MKGLSDEEREKLKAAHDAALQRDPVLRQNLENARKALREAMIRIDPSVQTILEKMSREKPDGKRPPEAVGSPGMTKLTEEERQLLRKVSEQVKGQRELEEAKERMKSASTPEARRQAGESYQLLIKAAMLKADPFLGPVLGKLGSREIPPPKGDH